MGSATERQMDMFPGCNALLLSGAAQCNEDSPVAELGSSERNDRLLKAEAAALEAGGCLVRLVGLYHSGRCDAVHEGVPTVLMLHDI